MSNNIRRVVQLICVKLGNHQPISLRSLIKSSETIYNKSFCFKEDYYDQSHFLSHKCYSDYSNRQFFWKIRSACYQPSCSHRCNWHYFIPLLVWLVRYNKNWIPTFDITCVKFFESLQFCPIWSYGNQFNVKYQSRVCYYMHKILILINK